MSERLHRERYKKHEFQTDDNIQRLRGQQLDVTKKMMEVAPSPKIWQPDKLPRSNQHGGPGKA